MRAKQDQIRTEAQVASLTSEVLRPEIPTDVATLYAWANLDGAQYRDFSAARREARARSRQRAAQLRYRLETSAREAAEQAARDCGAAARRADVQARHHAAMARRAAGEGRTADRDVEEQAWQLAAAEARQLTLRAVQQQLEASLRAAAQQAAKQTEHRESREAAEAQSAAARQAERYRAVQTPAAAKPTTLRGTSDDRLVRTLGSDTEGFGLLLHAAMEPQRFPSRRSTAIVGTTHDAGDPRDLSAASTARPETPVHFGIAERTPDDGRELGPQIESGSGLLFLGTEPHAAIEENVMPAWLREHAQSADLEQDPKPQRAAAALTSGHGGTEKGAHQWRAFRDEESSEPSTTSPVSIADPGDSNPMQNTTERVNALARTRSKQQMGDRLP